MKLFYSSFFALTLITCSSAFGSQQLSTLTSNPDMQGEGREIKNIFAQRALVKASCCALQKKYEELEEQLKIQLSLATKYAGKSTWINGQEVSYEDYWLQQAQETKKEIANFYTNS